MNRLPNTRFFTFVTVLTSLTSLAATVTLDSGDSVSLDFGFRTCELRKEGDRFGINAKVPMSVGANRVVVRAGNLSASATWSRNPR